MENVKWVKNLVSFIAFCGSMFLVFYGQKNIGYTGLTLQVVGLLGLLTLLYLYNRKFK